MGKIRFFCETMICPPAFIPQFSNPLLNIHVFPLTVPICSYYNSRNGVIIVTMSSVQRSLNGHIANCEVINMRSKHLFEYLAKQRGISIPELRKLISIRIESGILSATTR